MGGLQTKMVGVYSIKVGDASAKSFVSLAYEFTLNAISNSQVAIDGVTGPYFDEFDVDKEVLIYKNGTLTFKGTVINQNSLSAGGIILTCIGIEQELTESKCPMSGSTTRAFVATTDNSIISTLVTSVSGWTVDVSNSSAITLDSFRVSASESVWNGVIRLIEDAGKDFRIDQENKKVYLYDELTRTSKFSFIEGKNCTGISRSKGRTKAAKVIVYGKGDGDSQITGSHGSGVPVETLIDRNIISTAEANRRAENEYNKLNPQPKTYNINPYIVPTDLNIGDSGNISNNSANIDEEVDLVRLKVTVDRNGNEKFDMEVTNPAFRIASKNSAEDNAKAKFQYSNSQSSMQGSGNTLNWSRGINAKTGASLKMPFYVSSDLVEDDAGNLRISSMTLDYDIDPFRSDIGTASEDSVAVGLTPGSTDAHKHDATDTGHDHALPSMTSGSSGLITSEGSDTGSLGSGDTGWNTSVCSEGASLNNFFYCVVKITTSSGGTSGTVGIRVQWEGDTEAELKFPMTASDEVIYPLFIYVGGTGSSAYVDVDIYNPGLNMTVSLSVWNFEDYHNHSITGYDAVSDNAAVSDSNKTPGLAGNSSTHDHTITIGDDVSEAGSVNASEVDIYLDFWNTGTSNWDNKHSILNTGKTLDSDVDITDSGTYPDSAGYWRIRVEPDNASADYAQAIVKIKHNLDN